MDAQNISRWHDSLESGGNLIASMICSEAKAKA